MICASPAFANEPHHEQIRTVYKIANSAPHKIAHVDIPLECQELQVSKNASPDSEFQGESKNDLLRSFEPCSHIILVINPAGNRLAEVDFPLE